MRALCAEANDDARGLVLDIRVDLLSQGLGVEATRSNGLARLAGAWSGEELAEFERAVAPFEQIDDELWR